MYSRRKGNTMISEADAIMASLGYPQPVTAENADQAWAALKVEMECQRFSKRTGLPRSEVRVICNSSTGKAYPQWIHAIPAGMK